MQSNQGFVFAYRLGNRDQGRALTWDEVTTWQSGQGLLWIHLDVNEDPTLLWLKENSGLSPLIQEALLEVGTRPRSILTESGLLAILRGVNCNPGADPEDMVAIRMFVSEQRIISMRRHRVMAVQDVHDALIAGNGPITSGEFFVFVVERITDRIGEIVDDMEDRVAAVEDIIDSAGSAELRTKLAELRRESTHLRRYIAPQRDMLSRLPHERLTWLSETDKNLLRELTERTARFVEDIDTVRERTLIAQEELNHRLSEQMNRAMYTLSIIAAIFLPLGLLTGLLGINVGGIPGTDNPWAFLIVTLVLVLIAIFLILWFRKIRWL